MLLCEQNFRDVWSRNESVRAEICKILLRHAAKLVVAIAKLAIHRGLAMGLSSIPCTGRDNKKRSHKTNQMFAENEEDHS